MPSQTPSRRPDAGASNAPNSLRDRVRERVAAAEVQLADTPENPAATLETRALWRVFHDFGRTRRRHRRETGDGAVPALRETTHAFRRAPSLSALVAVAAFLDERGLLIQKH